MTTGAVPMAITMGDASGVGPEIVLRRAADRAFAGEPVVIYGDLAVLRHGAGLLGLEVEMAGQGGAQLDHGGDEQRDRVGFLVGRKLRGGEVLPHDNYDVGH